MRTRWRISGTPLPAGQGQRGFSMVEAMIGLTVLSIALLASIPLVLSSDRMSAIIAEGHLARIAARQKLDEVRGAEFSTLLTSYHNQGFQVDLDGDGTPDLQPIAGENYAGRVYVDHVPGISAYNDALRIRVVMRWRGAHGERSYQLFTVRTNY